MRNDGGFLLWWDGLRSEMQPIHDSQGVFAVLEKEVRRLGFDYYAYGVRHTIPFTRPKTEVHGTYPKAWLERYQMQNYGAVDPAILNGLRSSEMVVWSDSLFDQSRMLWNEARDWGLCVGATLPIRAPNNLLSVLSVARDQQNISSFEREEIRAFRCAFLRVAGEYLAGLARIRPVAEAAHDIVGAAAHQQAVDALVEALVAVVVAALGETVEPVDAAVGAGDETVQAGGDVVGQVRFHGRFSSVQAVASSLRLGAASASNERAPASRPSSMPCSPWRRSCPLGCW